MASAPKPFASTKETTNYARLCRLLVDVGSHALRETFDQILPAAGLHTVLTGHPVHGTLKSLRKKKILNPTQWGKLYPTIPSTVSSAGFDITLLMVLLRNICGLSPPLTTGWDSLPSASDVSKEANIARVKYFRNTVYGHASQASVDDATFHIYWQDISKALVGLGGASYGAIINDLRNDGMDPDTEEHYKELLTQWKKDEDSIKDKLEEIEELLKQWKEEKSNFEDKLGEVKGNIEDKLGEVKGNIKDKLGEVKGSIEDKLGEAEGNIKDKLEQVENQVKNLSEKMDNMMEPNETSRDEARLQVWIDCETISGPGSRGRCSETVVTSQVPQAGVQRDTVIPITSCQQQASYTAGFTGENAGNEGISSSQGVLNSIAYKYFMQAVDPSKPEELNGFLEYMKEIRKVLIVDCQSGSLVITVECSSLEILEGLWEDYCSGYLNEMAQKFLVTDDILKEFGLIEVTLTTTILEEQYRSCREHFLQRLDGSHAKDKALRKPEILHMGNIKDKLEQVENQVKNLSEKMDNMMEPNETSREEEESSSTITGTSKRDLPFSSSEDATCKRTKLVTSDLAEEGSSTNTSKRDLPLSSYQDAKGKKRATSDLEERDLPLSSSQDAKGRKRATSDPTEPFNLVECQKQLHSFYNTMNKVKIVPWDESNAVHIKDIYTNLSWVKDDRTPKGATEKKLEDYTEILDGDKHHSIPNRILVGGRPGIGKSTFSKKAAFDWSQQIKEMQSKFDLVLRIALRDVCNLPDIRDVLRASKLLAGDSKISIDSLYDYILQNQEKVLLILDGYDEYSCTGEQSPIRDIWEGTLLRDCRVILTARDVKADEVKYHSHVQFKINGFNSEDQVKAFASKFLKGNEDVQEFVKYLKENDLMGMAEIPLLLLMLCLIWQEKHHTGLPTSRADIYTNFIQTLLDHMIAKDADSKQFKNVHDYNEELCKLGKLAFDALLRDSLVIHCSELPDDNFVQKLSEAGLCQILNLSGRLNRGKGVYFIHKSIQEFLAAWYLKEELLSRKDENTTCLSKVDSFEKTVKMIEVFKFACELSADAACTILNHLGMIGNKEGLIEYTFTETPSDKDLSNDQTQFLTLISHSFFCCTAEKRQDLYTVFLSYVGGVLLIDSDKLHSVANEHLLKSAEAPKFIFFSSDKHSEQGYRDLITVTEDLNAVVVSCSGEMKAADLLMKHPFRAVNEFVLKKEDEMKLYIVSIERNILKVLPLPIEMLKELISSPKSSQTKKKPVGDQSNEQDNRTALCLTENVDITSGPTRHCLSCVRNIVIYDIERKEMETLLEVLPFVTSPRVISIDGKDGEFTHDAQLAETLVSRINFTNRLDTLYLGRINLTAKPAAVIARSLSQAPNLRVLGLSFNPLGEAVSDLTRHLSCVPHLETLYLHGVKMTKKQVNDLTAAVRQSNISTFESSYHDVSEGNPKPEHEWPTEEYWKLRYLHYYRLEDESDAGSSAQSETEQEDE